MEFKNKKLKEKENHYELTNIFLYIFNDVGILFLRYI